MFLYFSDWTTEQNLHLLDSKGFPHGEKLIKVFASREDPSKELGHKVQTVESDGSKFTQDFKIPGRGTWLSGEMEAFLNYMHITEEAKDKTRALFRFADSPKWELSTLQC